MFVYLAKFTGRDAVKIGKTNRLKTRFRELAQVHGGLDWVETCEAGAHGARHLEEFLHQKFKPFGIEIPRCDGHTEFYDAKITADVKRILRTCSATPPEPEKKHVNRGTICKRSGGNLYWRVKVPADLKHLYENRQWATQRSLFTKDMVVAEQRAFALREEWEKKFQQQREKEKQQ